jgi:signal transduction histidine kinase/ligand-binding sensor domain-containing protein
MIGRLDSKNRTVWGNGHIHRPLLIILAVSCLLQTTILPHLLAQTRENLKGAEQYRAVHWDTEDSLSNGIAVDMIKDRNGFLWIGTNYGLNRFDGGSFKKYFTDKSKNNKSITGNNINGLVEDSLHNIWIGTDKGLSCYDILADTFRNIFSDLGIGSGSLTILPFWATRDEIFCWDYAESQMAAFNIHTLKKRPLVKILPTDSVGNGVSDHYPVYDGKDNSIWLNRQGHTWANSGLLKISLSTGEKKTVNWPCFKKIPNHDHGCESMRYDRKRNAIWIASPDGLVEFTLDDHQFHHYNAFDELEKTKDFHRWAGIDIDSKDRIWMGTYPTGIVIYDPESKSVQIPFPDDSATRQKVGDYNVLIYCDRDNMVWTGAWSSKGINQIIPFSPTVKTYFPVPGQPHSLSTGFIVNCVYGGHGKIWIGTIDGINIFDTLTESFNVLHAKDLPGFRGLDKHIFVISIDTSSQKALISSDRLYQMDMTNYRCSPVIFKDTAGRKLSGFSDGYPIPFGSSSALLMNETGKEKIIFQADPDGSDAREIISFSAGNIDFAEVATNHSNFIFLKQVDAPFNLTYFLNRGKWNRVSSPLDSIPWERIVYNMNDQTYWFPVNRELYHYDKEFRQIRIYTQRDGLPALKIFSLVTDNDNNLWFNTESSIHRLDLKSGRITVLSEKDGYRKQLFTEILNFSTSPNGDLYLPGGVLGDGFTRITPEKNTQTTAEVYLQSLEINQKPFPIPIGIYNLKEISLSYFQNNITLETGVMDFNSGGNSHLRFKIRENDEWQYPNRSAKYTIHYEDLAPRDYLLIMQASNASNEFNGPERILLIHLSPPWWQTWWARLLFVATFALVLWSFIQYRSRNLKQRNVALEEKVMERTKELKYSLEELRGAQTQLIQREKMASLGELTAGIAHEIQNPLNFVNNFSDVNSELIEELKSEQKKTDRDLKNEEDLLNDILQNELKINHHGKRADAIVKGMLQHSRTSTGQKEPTDINALTDEYLRLSYHGLRAKDKSFNASMQTDYDQTIGQINAIPQDIGRVLLNLFNNAFYSVQKKQNETLHGFEPTVTVSTKNLRGAIEIKVRDNGTGIPKKVLEKIYQPFFTTKPPGEGTGLGLSLSYDIVTKSHGGELKLDTKEGEFAEFTVRLPT